jgi:hypothetical protein
MKNNVKKNRMNMTNHQFKIPDSKLLTGSTANKYPVILDGGRTIIFIADKSLEAETRLKYELRRGNMIHPSQPTS